MGSLLLTYIVVAVFYQKSNALPIQLTLARSLIEPISDPRHIGQQTSVPKGPPGQGVDNGGRIRVVFADGLEDGQLGEGSRGSHPGVGS